MESNGKELARQGSFKDLKREGLESIGEWLESDMLLKPVNCKSKESAYIREQRADLRELERRNFFLTYECDFIYENWTGACYNENAMKIA